MATLVPAPPGPAAGAPQGRAVCLAGGSAAASGGGGGPSPGAVAPTVAGGAPAGGRPPPSGTLVSPWPPPGVLVMVKRHVSACARQLWAKSHTSAATRAV